MDIASLLFPQAPSYATGLLGEEEAKRLQGQARQAGLLNLGLGLLAAGGPAAVRPGLGQGLVQGLSAGQQAYQQVYNQRLQEMELARKIADQRRQEQMRQLSGSIIQRTPGMPAQFAEESDGNVQIGQMPTAGGLQLDPQRLMALAALSDNPLAALKAVPEIVQGMRKVGLTGGAVQQEVSPFAVFLASDNPNIKAVAQQYDRAFKAGQIDDQQTGRAIEAMARMAETAGKPIADIASYENYRKQEVAEGRTPKSYEDFLVNLRRSGAATQTTTVLQPGAVAPGAAGMNEVDKALLSTGERLQSLDRIAQAYKPEFLQTRFQAAQKLIGLGEKLGREPSADERQNLAQYSKFKQDSVRQLNQYINAITGAAIGQGEEAERIKSGVPNPGSGLFDGDSPTEFAAKLDNTIRDLRMVEARLHYIKTSGLKLSDVKIDQMPDIMRRRKNEMIRDFGLDENNPEDREVLRNRLASEFGLLR